MPDFVPDDIDEYVKRAQRLDRIASMIEDKEVEEVTEELAELILKMAEILVEKTGISVQESVAGTTAIVAGVLAEWYRIRFDEEDED